MTSSDLPDLETLTLLSGGHTNRKHGVCAMEAVAWLAGEPHSDRPQCACPVIADIVRWWNDSMNDADRNRLLKPLLPKLVGSRSTPEVETKRRFLALDWCIRIDIPVFLDQIPSLASHAKALRDLAPLKDIESVKAAKSVIKALGFALALAIDLDLELGLELALDLDLDLELAVALASARGARGASVVDLIDRMVAVTVTV